MHTEINLPGIQQFRLDGATALVTGGSRGLGLAMAAGLASAGAKVCLAARNGDQAQWAARALEAQFGIAAFGTSVDVTQSDHVQQAVDTLLHRWGRLDIVINSAGINHRGPIDELTPEQFDEVMRVNVRGTWNVCRCAVPPMKAARYGRIINVASTLGLVGLANRTPYASSKGAVVQMTRALALELAPWEITCNAICPGPFLTDMNRPIADTEEAKRFIVGAVALERWGRLQEIQGAAIYLASPASSYTTGSMLVVDGGWTAR
ncbi:MAG: 2-deoxy-D-gluconate 3-dehydrogenase [Pirellulaceae bacterium]|nr:MAG: 2-deoxy-D-gluconate 3-dehydrogenase [Pirellulaceae bacterium]